METKVIKTLLWSECEGVLFFLARENLRRPKKGNITNFAKFIRSFNTANIKNIASFLEKNANRHQFSDCSSMALISENATLFSCEPASAMEIILRHLKILNSGNRLPALWFFLDGEKKAVVHFVNRKGWYAEAYFVCNEEFSVLHLLKNDNKTSFMPAVFAPDITPYVCLTEAQGGHCLQEYLPRETFQFLSNKSGKKKGKKGSSLPTDSSLSVLKDKGDML